MKGESRKFPGVGDRIRECLKSRGYVKDGREDVPRFMRENGYHTNEIYAWMKDRVPGLPTLQRLCRDLDCPLAWLLLGEEGIAELRAFERRRASKPILRERRVSFVPEPARNGGKEDGR
jgi:transcriptional regulator with XRE-family HTH domain